MGFRHYGYCNKCGSSIIGSTIYGSEIKPPNKLFCRSCCNIVDNTEKEIIAIELTKDIKKDQNKDGWVD